MTEEEWLNCTDPIPMLRFLLGTNYPRVQDVDSFPACKGSDRKLRLFACACYHRVRHLLPNVLARTAVEVAERFADRKATMEELQQAEARVWGSIEALEGRWRASQGEERRALLPTHEALALALQVVWAQAPKAAYYASSNVYLAFAAITNHNDGCSDPGFSASRSAEEKCHADILRCIFSNTFCSATITDATLAWNDRTAVRLAQGIYEERAFDRLPVLADALEESGCNDTNILNHLRGAGLHARGCWPVDLLLGKE